MLKLSCGVDGGAAGGTGDVICCLSVFVAILKGVCSYREDSYSCFLCLPTA